MVTFDHRDAGTAESIWAADERWRVVPAFALPTGGRALVVAAHPDDETLGAGGLIARLHDEGVGVTVLLATAGEASHGAELVDRRGSEFDDAVDVLAPGATVIRAGLPDARLGERADDLEAAITAAAVGHDLLVATWVGDGHGDHRIVGEVAVTVARRAHMPLLEYPIWLWHWADPSDAVVPWTAFVTVELDDTALARKRRALGAYASQTGEVGGEPPILHTGMLEHFDRTWETYVRSEP